MHFTNPFSSSSKHVPSNSSDPTTPIIIKNYRHGDSISNIVHYLTIRGYKADAYSVEAFLREKGELKKKRRSSVDMKMDQAFDRDTEKYKKVQEGMQQGREDQALNEVIGLFSEDYKEGLKSVQRKRK